MTTSEVTGGTSGRAHLRFAAGLLALTTLSACGVPLVLAPSPAREPISNLDAMEPGQVEVSAAFGAGLTVDNKGIQPELIDYATWGSPWSLAAAGSLGPVELRANYTRTFLWHQAQAGVGLRLPSTQRWGFVVDGGYAAGRFEGSYRYQVETSDGDELELLHHYGYRMHAPYGRARAVYRLNREFSFPVAFRYGRSFTRADYGLEPRQMEQAHYPELSAGVIVSPEPTCFQFGLGVHYNLNASELVGVEGPWVQASVSCVFNVREREWGR